MSTELQLVLGCAVRLFQTIQRLERNGWMWVMIQTGIQGKQGKQCMLDDVLVPVFDGKSPFSQVKSAFLRVILGFVAPECQCVAIF